MPEEDEDIVARAREDAREGKSPSTQAGDARREKRFLTGRQLGAH